MVVYCPKTRLELNSVNDWPVVDRIQLLNFRAHGNTETCENDVNMCSVAAKMVSRSSFGGFFQRPKPVLYYSAVEQLDSSSSDVTSPRPPIILNISPRRGCPVFYLVI